MADERFFIPEAARRFLRGRGYAIDGSMGAHIETWWQWYTRAAGCSSGDVWGFYNVPYRVESKDGGRGVSRRTRRRPRLSLNPAARACQEWASLVLNEDTLVSVDGPRADGWLGEWIAANSFWPTGQEMVEKAFALGTGAWALWADVRAGAADLRLRTYDARMVVPLSWDSGGVSECAFCTRAFVGGEAVDQLQLHRVGPSGAYVIETVLFADGDRRPDPEASGLIAEWDTGCTTPTFGIVRPGVSNVCSDMSPYGQSVFHNACGGAIQALDTAYDALFQEVKLTEAMVFMDESMIDVAGRDGKAVPVPFGEDGDRKFRLLAGQSGRELYEVYSPDIRTGPLREALDVALAEFGDQCGFGQDYFTLDKRGGLKTATEVSSDNSALMRNIRKHENALRPAIQAAVRALLTCARLHSGADIEEDFGEVAVEFDDSIVSDTAAEKAQMLAEVAAGVLPRWMYLAKFYGMSEEDARAAAGEASGLAAPEPWAAEE